MLYEEKWPITIERHLEGGGMEVIKIRPGWRVRMELREVKE